MGSFDKDNERIYFGNALTFFKDVKWLYNVPMTQILRTNVLNEFPEKWLNTLLLLENEELNNFVVNKVTKPQWPETLKDFVENCKCMNQMSSVNHPHSSVPLLPDNFKKGLKVKKQHEILHLAQLVHEQCTQRGIKMIVDLGAGLGYVCQLLHQLHGYYVLGLEGDEARVKSAKERQTKLYPESLSHVKYVHYKINENSVDVMEAIVKKEFGENSNICLIGLHACGDLSIHASEIFIKMKAARAIILISCCYHKLSVSRTSDTKQYFNNFPMSQCLQNAIKTTKMDAGEYLRQPFFRLACQEPADRWHCKSKESHIEHSFHVLARAVLDLYAHQNKLTLVKQTRKATRKSQCSNFSSYIRDALLRYTFQPMKGHCAFTDKVTDLNALEKEISGLWEEHSHKLKIVEIYTALQLMLQSPAESFILRDRLCWFWEQNLNVEIIPVMNKTLSPRSHAIVCWKIW